MYSFRKRRPAALAAEGDDDLSDLLAEPATPRKRELRRANTYSSFEREKLMLRSTGERLLRKPLRVSRVYGEAANVPESELGPNALHAAWARRNRGRPWWARIIHPNSLWRRLWDAITFVFVITSVCQVPLQLVLSWWPYLPLGDSLAHLNTAMRAWFVAEMVVNARTGYVTPNGTLVMDPVRIWSKYVCSGWLLLDLLGVIPIESLVVRAGVVDNAGKPVGGVVGRVWHGALRVRRFVGRVLRGQLRNTGVKDAWAYSALEYRCKMGTSDTALWYCEWHETMLEQAVNVWQLARQLQVLRLLKSARAHGKFWPVLRTLAHMGAFGDRTIKVLYLTKWAKLRRLLHLTHFWRIYSKWVALRRALRRSLSRHDLNSLVRAVSRHTGLDQLGELDIALDPLGMSARVASAPSRLYELNPGVQVDDLGDSFRSSPFDTPPSSPSTRSTRPASGAACMAGAGCLTVHLDTAEALADRERSRSPVARVSGRWSPGASFGGAMRSRSISPVPPSPLSRSISPMLPSPLRPRDGRGGVTPPPSSPLWCSGRGAGTCSTPQASTGHSVSPYASRAHVSSSASPPIHRRQRLGSDEASPSLVSGHHFAQRPPVSMSDVAHAARDRVVATACDVNRPAPPALVLADVDHPVNGGIWHNVAPQHQQGSHASVVGVPITELPKGLKGFSAHVPLLQVDADTGLHDVTLDPIEVGGRNPSDGSESHA
mmetsp:Transcript_11348/g.30676  ORF Transcript_11348/g.30676 Transcript_11348/m.30676 type:complete len:714 (+) Transcript_11348:102-2243(+)